MPLGSCAWEVRPVNGNDNWGGGYQVDQATGGAISYTADGTLTSANTSAPVLASASYNFVSGDVNDYVWLAAGQSPVQPGLYQIVSVASNKATLKAGNTGAVDSAHQSTTTVNNVAWAIDRSQRSSQYVQVNTGDTTLINNGTSNISTLAFLNGHVVRPGDVGNIFNITGGGTTGRYAILSVVTGANGSWVFDRLAGPANTNLSNVAGNMGGAANTIGAVMSSVNANGASGNKFFVKAEATIAIAASITINAPSASVTASSPMNRLIGYYQARGDIYQSAPATWQNLANRPAIEIAAGNSGVTIFNLTTGGWSIENFILDCNAQTTSTGIAMSSGSSNNTFYNVLVKNFTSLGITGSAGGWQVVACEVTGGTSAATAAVRLNASNVFFAVSDSYIHGNACPGIISLSSGSSCAIVNNLIVNNSGTSSDGLQITVNAFVRGNTLYGNGRHNIGNKTNTNYATLNLRNNLLAKAGGYGIQLGNGSSGMPALPWVDGNGFWSNTSGTRNDMDDGSYGSAPTAVADAINAVAPYANVFDVSCGTDPFNNDAGGDFTLNNNTPGGTQLRGTALPGIISGYSKQSYFDFGTLQHQDTIYVINKIINQYFEGEP
jgi:hypothetical protein